MTWNKTLSTTDWMTPARFAELASIDEVELAEFKRWLIDRHGFIAVPESRETWERRFVEFLRATR